MILLVMMTNMEINEDKPIEETISKEEPQAETTAPKDVIQYIDKLRVRNLYDFDWTEYNTADAVTLTGDQTVAGVKTFSSIPVLPASSPTTDNQAARKKYVDDSGGITSVATGFVSRTTPTDEGTTDLTVGFTPKVILFYAAGNSNGQVKFSNGIAKGTADADNTYTWGDSTNTVVADPNGGAGSNNCIGIMNGGTALVVGKVTTFGSTTTITWEVLTSNELSFSWTALA